MGKGPLFILIFRVFFSQELIVFSFRALIKYSEHQDDSLVNYFSSCLLGEKQKLIFMWLFNLYIFEPTLAMKNFHNHSSSRKRYLSSEGIKNELLLC